jgi:ribosomal protein L19
MKTNRLISKIIDQKKKTLKDTFRTTIPKVGDIIHVEYEHLTTPFIKTRKVNIIKHQFFGLCTSVSKKNLNFIFKIKNVLKKKAITLSFFFYSPLINDIKILNDLKKFNFRKGKLNFLSKKPLRYSKVRLDQKRS